MEAKHKTYIFIDESGIHKSEDNSVFVLVYIEINNYQQISQEVKKVESGLGIKFFHWSETVWPVREKFIEAVANLDFKIKLAVIKNPINPSVEMERVLAHMIIEKDIEKIFIDGKKSKRYEKKIKKILRDKGITVKKLKTVKDESEPGIRLADMVAGVFRWYFDSKKKDKIERYFKKLNKKVVIILN